jgi:hypothetical protein
LGGEAIALDAFGALGIKARVHTVGFGDAANALGAVADPSTLEAA